MTDLPPRPPSKSDSHSRKKNRRLSTNFLEGINLNNADIDPLFLPDPPTPVDSRDEKTIRRSDRIQKKRTHNNKLGLPPRNVTNSASHDSRVVKRKETHSSLRGSEEMFKQEEGNASLKFSSEEKINVNMRESKREDFEDQKKAETSWLEKTKARRAKMKRRSLSILSSPSGPLISQKTENDEQKFHKNYERNTDKVSPKHQSDFSRDPKPRRRSLSVLHDKENLPSSACSKKNTLKHEIEAKFKQEMSNNETSSETKNLNETTDNKKKQRRSRQSLILPSSSLLDDSISKGEKDFLHQLNQHRSQTKGIKPSRKSQYQEYNDHRVGGKRHTEESTSLRSVSTLSHLLKSANSGENCLAVSRNPKSMLVKDVVKKQTNHKKTMTKKAIICNKRSRSDTQIQTGHGARIKKVGNEKQQVHDIIIESLRKYCSLPSSSLQSKYQQAKIISKLSSYKLPALVLGEKNPGAVEDMNWTSSPSATRKMQSAESFKVDRRLLLERLSPIVDEMELTKRKQDNVIELATRCRATKGRSGKYRYKDIDTGARIEAKAYMVRYLAYIQHDKEEMAKKVQESVSQRSTSCEIEPLKKSSGASLNQGKSQREPCHNGITHAKHCTANVKLRTSKMNKSSVKELAKISNNDFSINIRDGKPGVEDEAQLPSFASSMISGSETDAPVKIISKSLEWTNLKIPSKPGKKKLKEVRVLQLPSREDRSIDPQLAAAEDTLWASLDLAYSQYAREVIAITERSK